MRFVSITRWRRSWLTSYAPLKARIAASYTGIYTTSYIRRLKIIRCFNGKRSRALNFSIIKESRVSCAF